MGGKGEMTKDFIGEAYTDMDAASETALSAGGEVLSAGAAGKTNPLLDDEADDRAKWYVVHTYSGHENKVKVNIEKIVENRGMQDLVLKIIVPTEDRVEIKNGQRKVKTRKMFPGYVLVKMIVTNESWYLVRNTQGVTGFVGHGSEPIPLTRDEVRRMGIEKIYIDLDIDVGDTVKVINGPFESFMGAVEEVNMERQTLKARISMFGRDTPVELEFGQVDKI
jgi:transcriptional antiterminator NusG